MSWFTDMAGRAEQLLNDVDQRAGQALTNTPEKSTAAAKISREHRRTTSSDEANARRNSAAKHSFGNSSASSASISTAANNRNRSSTLTTTTDATSSLVGNNGNASTATANGARNLPSVESSRRVPAAPTTPSSDQHLFDYLNAEAAPGRDSTSQRLTVTSTTSRSSSSPPGSKQHSRQSSRGSLSSIKTSNADNVVLDRPASSSSNPRLRLTPSSSSGSLHSGKTSSDGDYLAAGVEREVESDAGSSNEIDVERRSVAGDSLRLENRMLKKELTALNNEMMTLMERSRDSQDMVKAYGKREKMMQDSQIENDEQVRKLRNKLDESADIINQSESQVKSLEKRLEEMKTQYNLKNEQFETVNSDRDRILNEHSSVSGVQGEVLESLKVKLSSVESQLLDSENQYQQLKNESMDKQTSLDQEKIEITENLTSLQTKLHTEKDLVNDLNTKLRQAKNSSDLIKNEFSAYKEKATRILQSKDKLLASLKNQEPGEAGVNGSSSSSIELSETCRERDSLRDEVVDARITAQTLKSTIQDLESQLEIDAESHSDQLQRVRESHDLEKTRREECENELSKLKLEHRYSTDELHKLRLQSNRQITERDAQIDVLRNQLTAKSMSSSSSEEQERQVHSLTERLIQKQGIIEVLNSEKNSLVLQLERTEKHYRESESAAMRATVAASTTLNLTSAGGSLDHHDSDDLRQRLPLFLRSGVNDGQVARKVKFAANSIDRFSIRLGIFLRRYPVARILVIIYMALLHLLVTTVILTYQPEIHSNNPNQPS